MIVIFEGLSDEQWGSFMHSSCFIIDKICSLTGFIITDKIFEELESKDYHACIFSINNYRIAYRVGKKTPTKDGYFVTFWKRDFKKGAIRPFDAADNIDFFIIALINNHRSGYFIFDQSILIAHDIISLNNKGGKRAFRIYPQWTFPLSSQAIKTQKWQAPSFIDYDENSEAFNNFVKNKFYIPKSII